MKPGIVLSSFTSTLSAVDEEVDPREPAAAALAEVRDGELATSSRAAGEIRAGTTSSIPPGVYFAS